jgi:hypothetical protein
VHLTVDRTAQCVRGGALCRSTAGRRRFSTRKARKFGVGPALIADYLALVGDAPTATRAWPASGQ